MLQITVNGLIVHNQAMVKINEAEAATAGSWDVHEFGLLSLFVALVSGTASFSS